MLLAKNDLIISSTTQIISKNIRSRISVLNHYIRLCLSQRLGETVRYGMVWRITALVPTYNSRDGLQLVNF